MFVQSLQVQLPKQWDDFPVWLFTTVHVEGHSLTDLKPWHRKDHHVLITQISRGYIQFSLVFTHQIIRGCFFFFNKDVELQM